MRRNLAILAACAAAVVTALIALRHFSEPGVPLPPAPETSAPAALPSVPQTAEPGVQPPSQRVSVVPPADPPARADVPPSTTPTPTLPSPAQTPAPAVSKPAATAPDAGLPLVQELRAERNDVLRRELLARWNRENRPGTEAAAEWALSDPDPTVILQAIEILKNRKTRSAAPAMMRVIEQNRRRPDGYGTAIREAAATALGACGNAAAVPLLLKELEGHDDLSYDVAVVKALGDIGEIAALPAVESQLRRLETLKPTEALALGPWRQAMETAQAARQKLSGTRADSP